MVLGLRRLVLVVLGHLPSMGDGEIVDLPTDPREIEEQKALLAAAARDPRLLTREDDSWQEVPSKRRSSRKDKDKEALPPKASGGTAEPSTAAKRRDGHPAAPAASVSPQPSKAHAAAARAARACLRLRLRLCLALGKLFGSVGGSSRSDGQGQGRQCRQCSEREADVATPRQGSPCSVGCRRCQHQHAVCDAHAATSAAAGDDGGVGRAADKPASERPMSSKAKKVLCRFFPLGKCRNGDDCPFRHVMPPGVEEGGGSGKDGNTPGKAAKETKREASGALRKRTLAASLLLQRVGRGMLCRTVVRRQLAARRAQLEAEEALRAQREREKREREQQEQQAQRERQERQERQAQREQEQQASRLKSAAVDRIAARWRGMLARQYVLSCPRALSGGSQSTSSTSSLNPSRPEHVAEYNPVVADAAARGALAATARRLGKLTPTEPSAIHANSPILLRPHTASPIPCHAQMTRTRDTASPIPVESVAKPTSKKKARAVPPSFLADGPNSPSSPAATRGGGVAVGQGGGEGAIAACAVEPLVVRAAAEVAPQLDAPAPTTSCAASVAEGEEGNKVGAGRGGEDGGGSEDEREGAALRTTKRRWRSGAQSPSVAGWAPHPVDTASRRRQLVTRHRRGCNRRSLRARGPHASGCESGGGGGVRMAFPDGGWREEEAVVEAARL